YRLLTSMSYDAFASTFSHSRKNLRWGEIEYFVEYIKKHSTGNVSILDVGCGNGRFLDSLNTSNLLYSYLGIDESSGMIAEAQKLHPENTFKVLDMNKLEELSDSNKYQFIVFIASFHHLRTEAERNLVLNSAKKLLAPDGVIMMTNWNLLGSELFPKYEKSHKGHGDFGIKIGEYERYYHGFELSELGTLFQRNRYEILENRIFEGGKNIVSILKSR
ncbi:MAG: class I SAM-dependent methyltransferase, partial [Candidatus Gracilibacteria bacterium]|nr:class I SAM-dependent methyltransferase [Candidatus Gracilibacteria bacterium]